MMEQLPFLTVTSIFSSIKLGILWNHSIQKAQYPKENLSNNRWVHNKYSLIIDDDIHIKFINNQ